MLYRFDMSFIANIANEKIKIRAVIKVLSKTAIDVACIVLSVFCGIFQAKIMSEFESINGNTINHPSIHIDVIFLLTE